MNIALVEMLVTARFRTYEFYNISFTNMTYVEELSAAVDFERHNRFELVPLLLFAHNLFPDSIDCKVV